MILPKSLGSWVVVIGVAMSFVGCSGGASREAPPSISPADAGKAAVTEYDTNHDGVISGDELNKCPALKSALKRYDTNGDGKVTADNIAARIEKWQATKTAIAPLSVALTLDGQKLVDAKVTAEPEKFLGPAVELAVGLTDQYGNAALRIPGKVGANYGLYKIRVSKVVGGKETIPAIYNVNTELGLEFGPDAREVSSTGFSFSLKSR